MFIHQDRHPDNGIVYRRSIIEFWIPSSMAGEMRYNPNHVPVQRIPDPLWYYMWYTCLALAYITEDDKFNDDLLIEVLRR